MTLSGAHTSCLQVDEEHELPARLSEEGREHLQRRWLTVARYRAFTVVSAHPGSSIVPGTSVLSSGTS